jgi:O-antigen ligase
MEEMDVEAGSPIDRDFLSLMLFVGICIVVSRRPNWNRIFRDNRWLIIFFAFMAVSILWSHYPMVSVKRWIRSSGSILMAIIVMTERSPEEALKSVLKRSTYILIPFSVLLVKYYSSIGHEYDAWSGERTWIGVTTQKNALGRLCLISLFYLFWDVFRRWRNGEIRGAKLDCYAEVLLAAMTVLLLHGSLSATSFLVSVLGIGTFIAMFVLRRRLQQMGPQLDTWIIVGVILLTVAVMFFGDMLLSAGAGVVGRDTTLTGRTDIWRLLMPKAAQNPILGQGYGSFWVKHDLPWPWLNEGHNGYLDVVLELGGVGLVLLLGFLLSFYREARRGLSSSFWWAGFNLCFLLMAVIHNMTESSFARSNTYLWSMMILLAVVSPQLYRRKKEEPAQKNVNRVTVANRVTGHRHNYA